MRRKMRTIALLAILFSIVLVVACNNEDSAVNGKGSLKVLLTDAPFPCDEVESVQVTIDQVSIKRADDETTEDTDESGFIILSDVVKSFNLLDLRNGSVDVLADVDAIEAGTYTEIRLHIVSAQVTLVEGETFDLKIPSGTSSGLKIKIMGGLVVHGGNPSAIILDFDVSRSFLVKGRHAGTHGKKGKINGFMFKPVIRAVAEDISGSIEGTVTDKTTQAALSGASVRLINEADLDTMIAITNDQGYYAIIGLLPDTYKVIAEAEGFINDTVPAAVIETNKTTEVNFTLNAVPVETPPATGGN